MGTKLLGFSVGRGSGALKRLVKLPKIEEASEKKLVYTHLYRRTPQKKKMAKKRYTSVVAHVRPR